MNCIFIYITTKNKKEAEKIGREIVKRKLAVCANIIKEINSIYWWKGRTEEVKETILIVKTKEALLAEIVKEVKKVHSYECPGIVSFKIAGGSKEYLKWIEKSVK